MPTPSVKAASLEIYARTAYHFGVNGANFLPEIKLLFDPPLQDKAFRQLVRKSRVTLCRIRVVGSRFRQTPGFS